MSLLDYYFLVLFGFETVSHIPGGPQIFYVANNDLKLFFLPLPPPPRGWGYRLAPPGPAPGCLSAPAPVFPQGLKHLFPLSSRVDGCQPLDISFEKYMRGI